MILSTKHHLTAPVYDPETEDWDEEHSVPVTVTDQNGGIDVALLSGFGEDGQRDPAVSPLVYCERRPDGWAIFISRFGCDDPIAKITIPDSAGYDAVSHEPVTVERMDMLDRIEFLPRGV